MMIFDCNKNKWGDCECKEKCRRGHLELRTISVSTVEIKEAFKEWIEDSLRNPEKYSKADLSNLEESAEASTRCLLDFIDRQL